MLSETQAWLYIWISTCWLNTCKLWSFATTQYILCCFSNDTNATDHNNDAIQLCVMQLQMLISKRFAVSPLQEAKMWEMIFVLYSLTQFTTQLKLLVCKQKRPPPNKGAVTTVSYWSYRATRSQRILHSFTAQNRSTRKWFEILRNRRTNLTLSHTFSPHFLSSLPHITSCLGSCMLTAAQITGPQTWRRPTLRRGTEGALHLGQ